MMIFRKILIVCLCVFGCACTKQNAVQTSSSGEIAEDTLSDQKDDVALYLVTYQKLPSCYMTKKEARKQGWESGALHETIEGKCIGGDVFGNYEETLPAIAGTYYECDIDTLSKSSRGAKRIIYDDDVKDIDIYYTDDHYETFTLLYGDGQYE